METLIKIILVLIIIEKIIKLVGLVCNTIRNITMTIYDEAVKEERKLLEIKKDKKISNDSDLKQFLFVRSEK